MRGSIWALLVVCLCGVLASGCKTTNKPESARFASVEIRGNTPGQIHDMAVEVFREHGYKVTNDKLTRFYCEKEGSQMSNIAYGNWVGDVPVWVRVKVAIEDVVESTYRLQCHAYMVRDRGGSTEEEIEISNMRSGPYRKLLEEVARRLGSQAEFK